jgi:arsenate reductase
LQLLNDAIVETPVRPLPPITVLCDPNADCLADLSAALRTAGYVPDLQDIVSRALSADELRRLSQMLSGSTQSLVRRYDALFFELELDDRFMGDQEFWTAVSEHPALINGPVLVHEGRARVCKSGKDVAAFLSHPDKDETSNRKLLSPRMAALIRGEPLLAAMAVAFSDEMGAVQTVIVPESAASAKFEPARRAKRISSAKARAPRKTK